MISLGSSSSFSFPLAFMGTPEGVSMATGGGRGLGVDVDVLRLLSLEIGQCKIAYLFPSLPRVH